MTNKRPKKILAFAVTENSECTGAIIFSKHAVTARRLGANEYADGEFSGVTCKRAPWADHCAESGIVPAWLCIAHGWNFECSGCGVRIDADLLDRWREDAREGDSLGVMLAAARRRRRWKPEHVIGTQHSVVFCDQRCQDEHRAHEAERKRVQDRWIERFKKIIAQRFPDAEFIDEPERYRSHHHAYATKKDGRWHIDQVAVAFTFPGMKYGPARLEYSYRGANYSLRSHRPDKPHFTCCGGDKTAFEAWASKGASAPIAA